MMGKDFFFSSRGRHTRFLPVSWARSVYKRQASGWSAPCYGGPVFVVAVDVIRCCLLYTFDAADDLLCVDLGGRRIIKKKLILYLLVLFSTLHFFIIIHFFLDYYLSSLPLSSTLIINLYPLSL